MTCELNPNISEPITFKCDVEYVNETHFRIDFQLNLTRPYNSLFTHMTLYTESTSNEYIRYLDFWLDSCEWLNDMEQVNSVIHVLSGVFKHIKTNMKHKCPFDGVNYLKTDAISFDNFPAVSHLTSMFPPGNYITEIINYEHKDDPQYLGISKTYFSISKKSK